jgi:hypothetical protein
MHLVLALVGFLVLKNFFQKSITNLRLVYVKKMMLKLYINYMMVLYVKNQILYKIIKSCKESTLKKL